MACVAVRAWLAEGVFGVVVLGAFAGVAFRAFLAPFSTRFLIFNVARSASSGVTGSPGIPCKSIRI